MRIDSHAHILRIGRGDYGWITPDLALLCRDFGPRELEAHLNRAGLDRVVLVQAAPSVVETEFLLGIAFAWDRVAGVVGWIDMDAPDAVATLERLSGVPSFKAVRPMIHDIADVDWLLGDRLRPVLRRVSELDLAFDLLIRPAHLANVLTVLDRHPDLRAVICHGAKPDIAAGAFDGWARDMRRIAERTAAFVKLSGIVWEASERWDADELRPYIDHLFACFGSDRILWGSDWPVVTLSGGYEAWWETTCTYLDGLGERERAAVLGGNAVRVYKLAA